MSFGHGISINLTTPDKDQLHFIPITTTDHDQGEWDVVIAFAGRLVISAAIMVLLLMIVALIVKLLKNSDGEDSNATTGARARAAAETARLIAKEAVPFTYGTCGADAENGKCSNTSEELYDGKICVICYDQQRNCFFIPCGHCATCYTCARRITEEESKNCPVCRRFIRKDEDCCARKQHFCVKSSFWHLGSTYSCPLRYQSS